MVIKYLINLENCSHLKTSQLTEHIKWIKKGKKKIFYYGNYILYNMI